ncbi:MAG: DUF4349 domain-containing protein [Acidimicrobiia bacterium]|nr:DUF4349 domain-containing protein [Acidimicrobiia bacterium]
MKRTVPDLKRLVALLLAFAMVAAACASGDEALSDAEMAPTESLSYDPNAANISNRSILGSTGEAENVQDAQQAPKGDEFSGDGGVEPAVLQTDVIGRDIIYFAQLQMSAADVADASREASRLIQGLGGFLFGQQSQGGANATSTLTFKVFPKDFQEALDRLGSIGEIRSQSITADDVTERIVDIESRIVTAQASVTRLQAFLAEASDINTIATLEKQLLERETQLETLRGQLRTLEDQVALATIVLSIVQKNSAPSIDLFVTHYEGHNTGVSCPGGELFRIEQETPVTICYEIMNTGDTALANIELIDATLDIELDELTLVSGDPTAPLEPGDSFVVAHELVASENIRFNTNVSATPVDDEGEPIGGRTVGDTDSGIITTFEPEGIPTFMDGLAASLEVFVAVMLYAVLLLGAALPFLGLALVIWLVWRRWPRRNDGAGSPVPDADVEGDVEELVDA